MVPLKYLSNFWITLEMSLINCELNLISTWSENFAIKSGDLDQATTYTTTDAKLFVPVVTWSTEDNAKLLQQIKCGFKRIINWNKYQSKVKTQAQNPYLD